MHPPATTAAARSPGRARRPTVARPPSRDVLLLRLPQPRRAAPAGSRAAPGTTGNSAVIGMRLGIGMLVVGQSMIFGLALNLHDDVPPAARWLTQSLILCAHTARRRAARRAALPRRVERTPPRAAHHRGAVPAHDDRRDGRVAAGAPHRPREDLLRGRVGPARRVHARQADRRTQPRPRRSPARARGPGNSTPAAWSTRRATRGPCR